jgi:hypothetical protein
LVDVGSGRIITSFDWLPVFTNRSVTYLQGQSPLHVLDARDASTGPLLPALPLYVGLENGIIVVPLRNGGAAVLRREAAYGPEHEIPINEVAEGSCSAIDFARVRLADGTADCPGLAASAGTRRILVSSVGSGTPIALRSRGSGSMRPRGVRHSLDGLLKRAPTNGRRLPRRR